VKTLYIDTRNNSKIVIRLTADKKTYEEVSTASRDKAQAALPMIEKVIKKAKIKVSELNKIYVETGQGSFTGLRVGISIANALSFAGTVAVNGKTLGKIVAPEY
jgi:tRNA threonylcarbamoyladenosine biosynthesis protein TsaB